MITLYAPEYATNRPLLANKYRISGVMKGTANATAVHPICNFRITFYMPLQRYGTIVISSGVFSGKLEGSDAINFPDYPSNRP